MKMKTFQADSMHEALLEVKKELGPEAVILKTNKSVQNIMGQNRNVIEVTAALDEELYAKPSKIIEEPPDKINVYSRSSLRNKANQNSSYPKPTFTSDNSISKVNKIEEAPTSIRQGIEDEMKKLHRDFQLLISKVSHIEESMEQINFDKVLPEFESLQQKLVNCDMGEVLAKELLLTLSRVIPQDKRTDDDHIYRVISRILQNRLPDPEEFSIHPTRSNLFFVVGPTGAGKSTTLSKLCGILKYEKKLKVGVISTDHYRLGSLEQMFLFCRTMEIPFEAVYANEEFEGALNSLSNCDVILVDTHGGVGYDPQKFSDIKSLIDNYQPDEIALILSCTTRSKDQWECFQKYKELGLSKLVFTKIDESQSLGCLYQISVASGLPIGYLGNGQEIPDNLLKVDKKNLVSMLLDASGINK